jgi:hypothetical protein
MRSESGGKSPPWCRIVRTYLNNYDDGFDAWYEIVWELSGSYREFQHIRRHETHEDIARAYTFHIYKTGRENYVPDQ